MCNMWLQDVFVLFYLVYQMGGVWFEQWQKKKKRLGNDREICESQKSSFVHAGGIYGFLDSI